MSWPIAVAYLETKTTKADSEIQILQPCYPRETYATPLSQTENPPRGLQGTWLSQGPTQVSELIPAH